MGEMKGNNIIVMQVSAAPLSHLHYFLSRTLIKHVPGLPLCLSHPNNGDNNIILCPLRLPNHNQKVPWLGLCIALHSTTCLVTLWLIFNCWRWLIRKSQRENLINATTTFLLSALWWAPFFFSSKTRLLNSRNHVIYNDNKCPFYSDLNLLLISPPLRAKLRTCLLISDEKVNFEFILPKDFRHFFLHINKTSKIRAKQAFTQFTRFLGWKGITRKKWKDLSQSWVRWNALHINFLSCYPSRKHM